MNRKNKLLYNISELFNSNAKLYGKPNKTKFRKPKLASMLNNNHLDTIIISETILLIILNKLLTLEIQLNLFLIKLPPLTTLT